MHRRQGCPTQDDIDLYWQSYQPESNMHHQNNVHSIQQVSTNYNPQPEPIFNNVPQNKSSTRLSASTKYPADFQLAVYGSKGAIQVKPCVTRKGFYTIALEGAGTKQGQNRVYNWEQKIVVQLTRTELLDFIAVLLCHKSKCEYSAHGENNDKGFKLLFQPDRQTFYLSLNAPRQSYGCEVPYMEAMQIGHLCLSLYIDNYPGLTTDSVLFSLRQMTQMCNATSR